MGEYEFIGSISHSTTFEYFPYDIKDESLNTFEIISAISPFTPQWQVERELSLLSVRDDCLERPFNQLSGGERTKILIAAMFLKENNFLLIDEPTNHLDLEGRKALAEYLNKKSGFIVISHDRAFLDICTNYTLSINRADIEIIRGSYSDWQENRLLKDNFELAQNKKINGEISSLQKAAASTSLWSDKIEGAKYNTTNSGVGVDRGYIGAKSARMMKRAKAIEKRANNKIEETKQLLKNLEESEPLKLSFIPYHSKKLIYGQDISIFYDNFRIVDNINFEVNVGDRISIVGKNGSGKSSLIKLLLKEDISFSGELYISPQLKISYVPQISDTLKGNLKDFAKDNNIDESLFKAILRKFGFERVHFDTNIENFSMGQKKKVQLAKSLCEKAHIYIWDEPLNYIDLLSRIQLEDLILKYLPTIIFVEHDSTFCKNIQTKKIYL